jgi:hypothetical protein
MAAEAAEPEGGEGGEGGSSTRAADGAATAATQGAATPDNATLTGTGGVTRTHVAARMGTAKRTHEAIGMGGSPIATPKRPMLQRAGASCCVEAEFAAVAADYSAELSVCDAEDDVAWRDG